VGGFWWGWGSGGRRGGGAGGGGGCETIKCRRTVANLKKRAKIRTGGVLFLGQSAEPPPHQGSYVTAKFPTGERGKKGPTPLESTTGTKPKKQAKTWGKEKGTISALARNLRGQSMHTPNKRFREGFEKKSDGPGVSKTCICYLAKTIITETIGHFHLNSRHQMF